MVLTELIERYNTLLQDYSDVVMTLVFSSCSTGCRKAYRKDTPCILLDGRLNCSLSLQNLEATLRLRNSDKDVRELAKQTIGAIKLYLEFIAVLRKNAVITEEILHYSCKASSKDICVTLQHDGKASVIKSPHSAKSLRTFVRKAQALLEPPKADENTLKGVSDIFTSTAVTEPTTHKLPAAPSSWRQRIKAKRR